MATFVRLPHLNKYFKVILSLIDLKRKPKIISRPLWSNAGQKFPTLVDLENVG